MKKIILGLAFTAMLTSCGGNTPESAAKNFTENIAKGEFEEAKKYATKPTAKLLDLLSAMGGAGDKFPSDASYEFKMVSDSIVKNKAWVKYKDDKDKVSEIEVVKVDGKWLVQFKK